MAHAWVQIYARFLANLGPGCTGVCGVSVFSCAVRDGLEKGEEETARKCCNASNAVSLVRSNISNL